MATTKDIVWSKATYTPTGLIDKNKYKGKFPLIILVTRGYYGQDDIETLATDQIARIHAWGSQKRIMARDPRGRLLSIPGDYPIKFEVLEKKNKRTKPRTLAEILNAYNLPIKVQFERKTKWSFQIGSQKYSTNNYGRLELLKLHVERFLIGNTIHAGVIDDKVMFVPMYVRIHLRVAEGLKQGTKEDWTSLKDMYARAVSHIRFDRIQGTRDIMLYRTPGEDDNGREKIVPNMELDVVDSSETGSNMIKMLPNWTLVLNINKDEMQRSLSPTSATMITSSVGDSFDNRYDQHINSDSETSTLSDDDVGSTTGSQATIKNVVRVSLQDGMDSMPHRKRADSRSSRATSNSTLKRSRRTQTPGDPRANQRATGGRVITGRSRTLSPRMQRSASHESLQDIRFTGNVTSAPHYRDDMDIVHPVRMDSAQSAPRNRRYIPLSKGAASVPRYGTRLQQGPHEQTSYGVLRNGPLSLSAHDLRQNETMLQSEPMYRHQSMQDIGQPDGQYTSIYNQNGLHLGLRDDSMNRNVGYIRRPGMERASNLANNSQMSTFPRSYQPEYRPYGSENNYINYSSTIPGGKLRMSLSNRPPLIIQRSAGPPPHRQTSTGMSRHANPYPSPPGYQNVVSNPNYYSLNRPSNYGGYNTIQTMTSGGSGQTLASSQPAPRNIVYEGTMTLRSNSGNGNGMDAITSSNYPVVSFQEETTNMEPSITKLNVSGDNAEPPMSRDKSQYTRHQDVTDLAQLMNGTAFNSYTMQQVPIEYEDGNMDSPHDQNEVIEQPISYDINHNETPLLQNGIFTGSSETSSSLLEQQQSQNRLEAIPADGDDADNFLRDEVQKTTAIAHNLMNGGDKEIYATVDKLRRASKAEEVKYVESEDSSSPTDPTTPPPLPPLISANDRGSPINDRRSSPTIDTYNHQTVNSIITQHEKIILTDNNYSNTFNMDETDQTDVDGMEAINKLQRSGSVRSLREVYGRLGRTPPSSLRVKSSFAVAPASEIFTEALNKPSTSTAGMVNGRMAYQSPPISPMANNNELAWQETSSYPMGMTSIDDSLKELDAVLKQADPDSTSQSSGTSSKHMEHFSFALSGEAGQATHF